MRLVTFDAGSGPRAGVQTDSGILDAMDLLGENGHGGVRRLIAGDRLGDLKAAVEAGNGEPIDASKVSILAPIPDPDKIICWEHPNHADEILSALDGVFKRRMTSLWPFP